MRQTLLTRRQALQVGLAGAVALAGCSRVTDRRAHVVIVGAGMAGLAAALRLEQAGVRVTIVEARDRIGGRVHTLRAPFAGGLHAEAGATTVLGVHTKVWDYAQRFALELRPWGEPGAPLARNFARGVFLEDGESGLHAKRGGIVAPLPFSLRPEESCLGLGGLFQRYIYLPAAAVQDPLDPAWSSACSPELDAISLRQLLERSGASADALELLALGHFGEIGDGLAAVSALAALREARFLLADTTGPAHLPQGNDALPLAMAAAVIGELRLAAPVALIAQTGGGVEVVCGGAGARETIRADRVLCTVPLPLLRTIDWRPSLSAAKRAAAVAIQYASVTRVSVETSTRFWHAQRVPATTRTDLAIGTILEASMGQPGTCGVLQTYSTGEHARRLAALDDATRLERCLAEMEQVLPGARAAAGAHTTTAWDDDPYARGAYAWFRPGDLTTHHAAIAACEGRIHFAGDHTSPLPGWMEGALLSAERAVDEILGVL